MIKFDNKRIDFAHIGIILLTIIFCFIFAKHVYWPLDDIGRELYYPELILNNKILYKDLFNFFGPFSYMFNALIFKFFGSGITVIYILGYFTAVAVISGIYSLTKIVLNKESAFIISLFTISIGITTTLNFNFYLPYAYAILYGFITFIWSTYFIVKGYKEDKISYLYLSALLAGISVCNKYEFLLPAFFLFCCLCLKTTAKKFHWLGLISLMLFPLGFCFILLFISGLGVSDMLNVYGMLNKIANNDAYKCFYTAMGTFYSNKHFIYDIKFLFYALLPLAILMLPLKIQIENKFIRIFLLLLSIFIVFMEIHCLGYASILCFLPILTLILFLFLYKKMTTVEKIVAVSAILLSTKVFWFCQIRYYGVYFAPLLVLALLVIIKKYKLFFEPVKNLIIIMSLLIICFSFTDRHIASFKIKIKQNEMYTFVDQSWKYLNLINYIKKNTIKTDKIVVYPEGLLVNYATGRPAENMYYILTPAHLDLFDEKFIIDYFTKQKPEYFILIHTKMEGYGKNYICDDYAIAFCRFVKENYNLEKKLVYNKIDTEPYYIYKKK